MFICTSQTCRSIWITRDIVLSSFATEKPFFWGRDGSECAGRRGRDDFNFSFEQMPMCTLEDASSYCCKMMMDLLRGTVLQELTESLNLTCIRCCIQDGFSRWYLTTFEARHFAKQVTCRQAFVYANTERGQVRIRSAHSSDLFEFFDNLKALYRLLFAQSYIDTCNCVVPCNGYNRFNRTIIAIGAKVLAKRFNHFSPCFYLNLVRSHISSKSPFCWRISILYEIWRSSKGPQYW